ncbi:hypothetical protein HNI00_19600 [Thermoleptolyngbya oregonensis NK1-22]|uniref:Uncharacterized protein n=1 Tax=Thermoleptolyngbya oregonensis NK1-22 TaxID=2547457 RepID=A0AA97BN76_9CYAN|nr:hypothetical protein [Thermoleptolyngbya oregonensis]WOB45102.1 hypothetical protein HNI00_19600 [Thermoleptolyngbya oregonensis NK1-22]
MRTVWTLDHLDTGSSGHWINGIWINCGNCFAPAIALYSNRDVVGQSRRGEIGVWGNRGVGAMG